MLEPRPLRVAVDHDERRQARDCEPVHEIGPLVFVDDDQVERGVVAAALEDLREEALDAPALPETDEVKKTSRGFVTGGRASGSATPVMD